MKFNPIIHTLEINLPATQFTTSSCAEFLRKKPEKIPGKNA